jgi:hypothetical protein
MGRAACVQGWYGPLGASRVQAGALAPRLRRASGLVFLLVCASHEALGDSSRELGKKAGQGRAARRVPRQASWQGARLSAVPAAQALTSISAA